MSIYLRPKDTAFYFIVLYPLINILVAFIFNRQGLRTTYIVFSLITLLLLIIKKEAHSSTINSKYLIFVIISLCAIALFVINNPSFDAILNGIVFVLFLSFMYIYSDQNIIKRFESFCIQNRHLIVVIEMIYLLVLLLSCVKGDGINASGWHIVSLKGPYEINHLLAYELLVFAGFSFRLWYVRNSYFQLGNSIVLVLLIFLTGVRSALLALLVLILYYLIKMKTSKTIIICFFGIFIIAILLTQTNIFDVVIQKTKITMEMGSISSSRPAIFSSSLKAYFDSRNSLLDYLFGIGLDRLTVFNHKEILMAIHAHNDFIDALVIFGISGFALYIYSVVKCFLNNKNIWLFILYFILAFFNGFYQYQFIVIGFPFLISAFDISKKVNNGGLLK